MSLSDKIAFLALIFSVIALPIGYILGARNLRNTTYNSELSKLAELCDSVFTEAINIHKKRNSNLNDEVDFHLMVAFHKRLQSKCLEIKELSKNDAYPWNELREVKQVITDQLVSDDKNIRDTAIRGLIYKLDRLKKFFQYKFI
ncbi:MAG: hypothetical protein E6369_00975 [Haemophilus parainfluenzae]|jgi:hypothetical protein|nr:hypothetical protein [Haemophilus parainfluenzae]